MTSFEKVVEQLKVEQKTWLVTGSAGFIGSNLIEFLLANEIERQKVMQETNKLPKPNFNSNSNIFQKLAKSQTMAKRRRSPPRIRRKSQVWVHPINRPIERINKNDQQNELAELAELRELANTYNVGQKRNRNNDQDTNNRNYKKIDDQDNSDDKDNMNQQFGQGRFRNKGGLFFKVHP